jgi:hypothetical protein
MLQIRFKLLTAILLFIPCVSIARYDVDIVLPECDYIISNAADWKNINSPSHSVFCVTPATYTYKDIGVVQLTQSGTKQKRRYLRWYDPKNPDDKETHIANIPQHRLAVIPQFRVKASYWIIDRIAMRNGRGPNTFEDGASNNILNRILIEGGTSTLFIRFINSSDNILQHSILRDTIAIPGRDSYTIYFHSSKGERIVNNEIYNYGGGIQQSPSSLGNHVIYGNEMYITDDLYTDCKGNRNKSGPCMCSEGMAVVLKGIDQPGAMFRIEKNLIYGHRRHDEFCMGSGTPGVAINLGSGGNSVRNVIIKDNVLLNQVPNNIYMGLHINNVKITGNVIGYSVNGITNVYGKNVIITNNKFVNNAKNIFTSLNAATTYENNRNINNEEKANLCFTVKKFTNPHTVCLPDIL